jgi:hypothetical protein
MRLGSRCALPTREAEIPSGRADIGGSGSPAPSTTRGGDADVAAAALADSDASLSDLGRSDAVNSDLAILLGDCADLAEPRAALVSNTFFAVAGGGCGGSPPAIRCRVAGGAAVAPAIELEDRNGARLEASEAALRSGSGDAPCGGGSPPDPAGEATEGARMGPGSRPFPCGGVLPEFTAYPPRRGPLLLPPLPSHREQIGGTPEHSVCRSLRQFQSESMDLAGSRVAANMAKRWNRIPPSAAPIPAAVAVPVTHSFRQIRTNSKAPRRPGVVSHDAAQDRSHSPSRDGPD